MIKVHWKESTDTDNNKIFIAECNGHMAQSTDLITACDEAFRKGTENDPKTAPSN